MSELAIPTRGRDKAELFRAMEAMRSADADWRDGRTFSLVYFPGEEHYEFLKKAHNLYFSENGLNPMAFQSLRRMEAEVVRMTANMLHGGSQAVGTMTSGGTESILLAVKSYRDRARSGRQRVEAPEIIAPSTIHPAFDKAAHYFGMRLRLAPVDASHRADVDAMRRLVNKNTVLIAASAPQYPHGVLDPIADVGALAQEKGLPFHVDACIGGFMLPWVEHLGYPVPPFDFRIKGVTSMSADVHKYGLAAKGASVVVYRDMSYLKHQFFISTDSPSGIYASPTMLGTRAGGSIAAAWASMNALGQEGYVDHARRAMQARKQLEEGIRRIPELEILGEPVMTILSYGAKDPSFGLYAVADQLQDRGWNVDRQQKPESLHLTITSHHLGVVDEYLTDLESAVAYVRAHPEVKSRGQAAMYGMMAKVPFRGMVGKSVEKIMEKMYGPDALELDMDKIGEDDEGLVNKLVQRYGGKVLDVFDKLGAARASLRRKKR